MLNIDTSKRLSLEDILKHDWVTDNGQQVINVDQFEMKKYGKDGFGNIERHITVQSQQKAKTSPSLE